MNNRSLTANAALTLLICGAMFMALLVMLQGAWQDWQRGEMVIRERTLAVARFYQTRQIARTTATEIMLATLAQAPSVRAGASENLDEFMRRLDVAQPDYLGFALFDTTGQALSAVAGGKNFSAQPAERVRVRRYFKGALENRKFTIGLGLSSRTQPGKMYLPMARPVLNADGSVLSIILAPLDMSRFSQEDMDSGVAELISQHKMAVRIMDGEGRVLYGSGATTVDLGTVLTLGCYLQIRQKTDDTVVESGTCEHLGNGVTALLRTRLSPGQAPYLQVLVQTALPSWWEFFLHNYYKSLLSIAASLLFGLLVARMAGRYFFSQGLTQLVEVASDTRGGLTSARCGQVTGCREIQRLGTGIDAMLDELERGNSQLREQRRRLEMALDAADMGVWRWQADTKVLLMDARGWGILGYDAKGKDDINVLTVVPEAEVAHFVSALEDGQQGGGEFSQEITITRADAETAWMHFAGRVTGNEGTRGMQGVCLDVTARRRVAELEREQMEHFRRLSTVDPLTELWNRRYFNDAARGEILRCLRNGKDVSIIMTDIDFFKKVNDTYGHTAGDAVLRHFAKVMRESVRVTDLVARYGGEEFVLMLPETTQENAVMVAEKVRSAFEAHRTPWEGKEIACTASFGVCSYVPQKDLRGFPGQKLAEGIAQQLVSMADASLYISKQQGRNRVNSCNTYHAEPAAVNAEGETE